MRRAGITLLELLIALVLVTLLVMVSIPRLTPARMRVELESRVAMKTMLEAQRAAVHRQHDVVVVFDTASCVMQVHHDVDNDGVRDTGEAVSRVRLSGVRFGRGPAPAHAIGAAAVTFARTQDRLPGVTFHASGTAAASGGFYLRADADDADARHVQAFEVDRSTGRTTRFFYTNGAWSSAH